MNFMSAPVSGALSCCVPRTSGKLEVEVRP